MREMVGNALLIAMAALMVLVLAAVGILVIVLAVNFTLEMAREIMDKLEDMRK